MSKATQGYSTFLPVGHCDEQGDWQRVATLRKMRGSDEALLYEPSLGAAELVSALLGNCIVKLGEAESVGAQSVAAMTSADRNYLLLELRRITLGDRLACWYTCPSCGREVSVAEDLGTIRVRRLAEDERPEPYVVELEDGWQDRHGTVHKRVVLRLPTGVDEGFVARTAERDPFQARDALLLRCIVSFGTLPERELQAYGVKVLRELTLGDRRTLFRAFEHNAPGVDFRRLIHCGHCGARFETVLDAAAFFELGQEETTA
jgi:hypothetical protein